MKNEIKNTCFVFFYTVNFFIDEPYGFTWCKLYFLLVVFLLLVSIVIFVLSAPNDCFLLGHENEFLVETSNSFECANKTIIYRTKYKHYFFYNRILKFLNFCKIFLGC
jgi:hypothetical protein